jgi:hypothetical protein
VTERRRGTGRLESDTGIDDEGTGGRGDHGIEVDAGAEEVEPPRPVRQPGEELAHLRHVRRRRRRPHMDRGAIANGDLALGSAA